MIIICRTLTYCKQLTVYDVAVLVLSLFKTVTSYQIKHIYRAVFVNCSDPVSHVQLVTPDTVYNV